eukprot:2734243-Pyramimonas_sp.AAC.1
MSRLRGLHQIARSAAADALSGPIGPSTNASRGPLEGPKREKMVNNQLFRTCFPPLLAWAPSSGGPRGPRRPLTSFYPLPSPPTSFITSSPPPVVAVASRR